MPNTIDESSSLSESNHPTAGVPQHLCTVLLGREGRDEYLKATRKALNLAEEDPVATKETLRVVLHLIRQDREIAEPTRSTMQKLNRFFMSTAYEPPPNKIQR